jgi:rare lipoprotein A
MAALTCAQRISAPGWLQALPLLAALLALAGCGTTSSVVAPSKRAPATPSAGAAREPGVPVLPPAGSGRGGYYKDDGPGDNPPPNLASVPDAEPKVEPYLPRANRPYAVFGVTYTPLTDNTPFTQRGIGSWYGKKFHGQRTSSGELYDMYKMTAAHPTLPIPSYARVTNVVTGKQVIVRINDRGPFHSTRVIDVSYTAALQLGFLGKGSHEVIIERLLPADIEKINAARSAPSAGTPPTLQAVTTPSVNAAPLTFVTAPAAPPLAAVPVAVNPAPAAVNPAPVAVSAAAPSPAAPADIDALMASAQGVPEAQPQALLPVSMPVVDAGSTPADPPQAAPIKNGFYLQLGAYSRAENAEAVKSKLAPYAANVGNVEVVDAGAVHRLFSGPFASRQEATQALAALPAGLALKPIIVQR